MASTLLRRVQMIELDILKEVDRICRRHHIEYFLDAGTALGAVRHGGFIPWDDDIDIGMLRRDYERFLSVARTELGSEYFLQNYQTDGAPIMFSKVHRNDTTFVEFRLRNLPIAKGVFIDIFPYDYLPADEAAAWAHIKHCADLYRKFQYRLIKDRTLRPDGSLGWYAKALLRRITHWAHLRYDPAKLVAQMDQAFEAYPESPLVTCHSYGGGYLFRVQDMLPAKPMTFEGENFLGPNDPQAFLSELYGDYMTLPPKHQRTGHRPYRLAVGLDDEDSLDY